MYKQFDIPKEHEGEVKEWLTENLSKENIRWWIYSDGRYSSKPIRFYIDVDDDTELPVLTTFMLKWS